MNLLVKNSLKQLLFSLAAVAISPITLLYLLLNVLTRSDSLFSTFSQLLSLLPGKSGTYLRAGFYRFAMTQCSPDAVISFSSLFSQRDTEIATGVYIGPQTNIGKCAIEKNVLLGSGVHVLSGKNQHNFDDLNTPIKDQGGTFEKLTIGQNSWVGNGAIIMANIGKEAVVAAGSVVTRDVNDFEIVAGNPAKVIKSRISK